MSFGPLRFLACVAAGTTAWAVSRVPVVIERAQADVAAAAVWAAGQRAAGELVAEVHVSQTHLPNAPESGVEVAARSTQPAPLFSPRHSGVPKGGEAQRRNDDQRDAIVAAGPPVQGASDPAPAVPALTSSPRSPTAFDLAATAYAALARRDRRAAARGFDAALAADPAAANAAAWRAEVQRLRRQWSGDAYVLVRGAGPTGLGVAPLLGGGQSGATLAFTPDPLARRPIAVVARAVVAHEGADFGIAGIDRGSLQTALGVRWQVMRGASLTAERLIAGGSAARDAWVLRGAGGVARKIGPVALDAYAEAGVVGARRRDSFASAQARATLPLPAGFDAGGGVWASVQDAATTVHRVDAGPTIGWRYGPLSARADWRFRVAGDAAPGSGPALTLSAAF